MNKYLLDTHVFLWLIFDVKKVPKDLLTILAKKENILYISAVSLWEISIKYKIGKLDLGNYTPQELMLLCNDYNIIVVDLKAEETSTLYKLNAEYHKDPFDRLLIWQAIQNNYTLVTIDKNIKLYKSEGLKTIW
jgi:PIN domain nuclease of toxin-antitoxin system